MYYNYGINGYDSCAQFRTAVTGAHKLYEFGDSLNRLDDRNADSVFEAFYRTADLLDFCDTLPYQQNACMRSMGVAFCLLRFCGIWL
ncbi:MAG: hypothetical protein IJS09_06115 [Treponema sp.]|nr:hypothetical protein [Treponema sp.]